MLRMLPALPILSRPPALNRLKMLTKLPILLTLAYDLADCFHHVFLDCMMCLPLAKSQVATYPMPHPAPVMIATLYDTHGYYYTDFCSLV